MPVISDCLLDFSERAATGEGTDLAVGAVKAVARICGRLEYRQGLLIVA